jgi:hypothetical protein
MVLYAYFSLGPKDPLRVKLMKKIRRVGVMERPIG